MGEEPQPEAGNIPADPFHPAHVGYVAVIENFRSYRRAGATWLEAVACQAAVFIAGHIIVRDGNGEGG